MRFATQEPCSCFRQQIFTKQEAKENVALHKNKAGGRDLWKCCCAVESGEDCLYFTFDIFIRFFFFSLFVCFGGFFVRTL